jgi:MYXO-CTERM domain-containing protein
MRTRTKQLVRVALVSLSLATAALTAPRQANAEADTFGIGDGHGGAYVAVGVDEIINAYAPLTVDAAANATQLAIDSVIGDATGFAAGDLVLIWRATGVPANEPGAASGSQTVLDLNTAAGGLVGRFEFARVKAVAATSLTLTKPITQAFAKDVTQVVKVPELSTVSVPAGTSIAASAWQQVGAAGFAGGIVAFVANGAVTVDGAIHADARGFRGGPGVQRVNVAALNCQDDDGTVENGYAPKGEGVVASEFGPGKGGRGNRSIAAGGGNCVENGGGGGGNKGAGGKGGDSVIAGAGTPQSGRGGAAIAYSLLSRMSLGGGGGAGEQKNGLGSDGGRGGGAVFMRARSLAGTGRVSANGESAANATLVGVESDGAGGGGAGGSIVLRLVENATCGGIDAKGGNGGDSQQAGLSVFGPGGGGAGGRVLVQAKSSAACPVTVTSGPSGLAGGNSRNAAAGNVGESEPLPAPGGNYCFSNATVPPQCANPSPVCDPVTGFCGGCSGPFGGGSPRACAVAVEPVCSPSGACAPCNGDFASSTSAACQVGGAPYCFLTGATAGACGKCASNADCGAGHGGSACNPTLGACGAPCTDDSNCKAGAEWCAQGVCVPKTPNGDHVPNVPPIDGECTAEKAAKVCLSAACEPDDDLCGLKNGSPCEGAKDKCRSAICFDADKLCGTPTGEPCTLPAECRSAACTAGVCTGCDDDSDCPTAKACDVAKKLCVDGCREVAGKSKCAAGKVCSKTDGTIGQCIDGDGIDGGIHPTAPPDTGVIEGGGCSCRTSMPLSGSPFAIAAAAVGAILVARRRNKRNTRNTNDNDNQDPS